MSFSVFVRKFDWVLLLLALAIIGLGVASYFGVGARANQVFQRQIIETIIGVAVLFGISLLDYRVLKNNSAASVFLYILAVILLVGVLATTKIRGASSWYVISNWQIQPSELAKLAILILLAKYFSQKHAEIYSVRHIFASAAYVAVPAALTLMQPDFGSMFIFGVLWVGMLLFSGVKRKHLLTILMIVVIVASMSWFLFFKQYQRDRIIAFVNPYVDPRGIGYNSIQAQTTFGSGKIMGFLTKNNQQNIVPLVPEPYTDFTFAAFGQRFGFAGVVILFALIFLLLFRIGSIAARTTSNFPKLFCLGLITIISIHIFMNAGMNIGILPITGIPFSFLSYGGSHLIMLMMGLGIVESIRLRG